MSDLAHAGEVPATAVTVDEDARLANLGYSPQLNRVLGFFENFAVAFAYLSPMVGIYSLFLVGVATGGPALLARARAVPRRAPPPPPAPGVGGGLACAPALGSGGGGGATTPSPAR